MLSLSLPYSLHSNNESTVGGNVLEVSLSLSLSRKREKCKLEYSSPLCVMMANERFERRSMIQRQKERRHQLSFSFFLSLSYLSEQGEEELVIECFDDDEE